MVGLFPLRRHVRRLDERLRMNCAQLPKSLHAHTGDKAIAPHQLRCSAYCRRVRTRERHGEVEERHRISIHVPPWAEPLLYLGIVWVGCCFA